VTGATRRQAKSVTRVVVGGEPRLRARNPYILTPLTDGVGFYGRDAALQFVRNTLLSPYQNVIVLFGQRRIGKTSLLHQLKQPEQTPQGFHPVYFDLQGRAEHRLEQVLYGLAREIARSVGVGIPPRSAFADDSFFQYGFLPRVYAALGEERILVLVDEFDVLGGESVPVDAAYHSLFPYLQDLLIDEQRQLTFVFVVGRRIDELPSRIKATFKSAQCKRIGVLDSSAATDLILEPAAGRVEYSDEAVTRLLSLTAGHPYFLQLLCYELFDRALRSGSRHVGPKDIHDDVLSAAMELGMGGLAWFWDEFPPAERFILSSIAHLTASGQFATLRQISRALHEHGVRLQGVELSTAPQVLAEWGIIAPAGRDAFNFPVEFLRRWIVAKHSLAEAKRELERVSARAVQLYEAALRLHREGPLERAIAVYHRALTANPNHARAQLGMAQALYETGRLDAAEDAFEKAYRLDPESARDGLVAAHRDLGIALESEAQPDRARPHFLRILDVLPEDHGARELLRDSWRGTAAAHLASGRWDQAAEAYREALRYMPEDAFLQRAVTDLERRHAEAEMIRWRRQQLERAVLESRLDDERMRRIALEARIERVMPKLLASTALLTSASMLVATLMARTVHVGYVAVAIGTSLLTISAAFAWARQRLGQPAPSRSGPLAVSDRTPPIATETGIGVAGQNQPSERDAHGAREIPGESNSEAATAEAATAESATAATSTAVPAVAEGQPAARSAEASPDTPAALPALGPRAAARADAKPRREFGIL